MISRKQKIKNKREQEEKEIRQVQMAVAGLAVIIVIGVIAYIFSSSDSADSTTPIELNADTVVLNVTSDVSGTPGEICEQSTPAEGSGQNGQYASAPNVTLEQGVDFQAVFCTSGGAIYLDLFEEQAPQTVANMVFLAEEGFYNNLTFHRVIEGFMAQGGDPTGTGSGGPGYQFGDEFSPDLRFDRPYLLAMANAGPGTNGSQFFITYEPTDWLNDAHTIFGEVISGQSAVDSLIVNSQEPAPDLQTIIIVTADQVSE